MNEKNLEIYNPIAHISGNEMTVLGIAMSTIFLSMPEHVGIVNKTRNAFKINLPINLDKRYLYLRKELKAFKLKVITPVYHYVFEQTKKTDIINDLFKEQIVKRFKAPQDFKIPQDINKIRKHIKQPEKIINPLSDLAKIITCYSLSGLNCPLEKHYFISPFKDQEFFKNLFLPLVSGVGNNIDENDFDEALQLSELLVNSKKVKNKYLARDAYYFQIKNYNPQFQYNQIAEYLWEEYPELYGFDSYLDLEEQAYSKSYETKLTKFAKSIERATNRFKKWIIECDNNINSSVA